jgi:hypothetical protein
LAEKGSIFFLYGSTRKVDTGAARLYQLFANLLLPGVLGEIPSDDLAAPATKKESAAVVSAAQACLAALLGFGEAEDKNVRLQVCRTAHACIDLATSVASASSSATAGSSESGAEVSDEAWSCLRSCLLPRLKDKNAAVRGAAAAGLEFLQDDDTDTAGDDDKEGGHDSATLELLRLSGGDSAKEVRVAATASFQLSKATLPALLERTR